MKKIYRSKKPLKKTCRKVREAVPGVNCFLEFFRKMAGLERYENRESKSSLPTLNDGNDAPRSR